MNNEFYENEVVFLEFNDMSAREISEIYWDRKSVTKYRWNFYEKNGKSVLEMKRKDIPVIDKEYTILSKLPEGYENE